MTNQTTPVTESVTTPSDIPVPQDTVAKESNVPKTESITIDSEFLPESEVIETVDDTVPTAETVVEPRTPQNLYLDGPVSKPNNSPDEFFIALSSDTDKRTREFLDRAPNADLMSSAKGGRWAEVIKDSLGMNAFQDTFVKTLEDPTAEFHQTDMLNNTRFGSYELKLKEKQNENFDGEMAVIRVISHLGLGSVWNTALYNSGLWITFKPPAEDDLVELHRQLSSIQITMGRSSYGMVYANTTSYSLAALVQFAVKQIYRVFADSKEISGGNVLRYIRAQDINSLLWGLACTMFPNGFPYSRACTADPEKCQHVANETLNLRKLQFVNRRALSDKQKAHMAEGRGSTKFTVKDIEDYQREVTRALAYRIVVNEGKSNEIVFNLKSPSIQDYIDAGYRWIEDMVNTVDQALGADSSLNDRNHYVDLKARATIMRQYSHWVDSIEIGTNSVKDRKDIENTLNSISGNQEIRTAFLKGVVNFIETSSVSVIGIPTYDCPVCGGANESSITYPHKSTVIPLDVIQLFFVLLTQKHRDLQNR